MSTAGSPAPGGYHPGMGRSRRGRGGAGGAKGRRASADMHASSVPTGRAAYAETRTWLLKTHGPVCAYCGVTYPARELTLDHVTPRRGQSAYDRRDNLVLACKRCNAAKADKPFLAWVLGARARAQHLLSYGQHLSEGILDLLRPIVGPDFVPSPPKVAPQKKTRSRSRKAVLPPIDDDGTSPYDEPSPYSDVALPAPRRPVPHAPAEKGEASSDAAGKGNGRRRRRRRSTRGGSGRSRRR